MRSTFWAKTPPKAGAAAWDTAAASSPYSLFGDGADRPGRCQRSGEPRVVDAFCVCELVEHPGPYADCPPLLCWACVGPCWGGLLWAFGRPADVDIVVFLGTAPYACGYVEPLLGLCWAMLAHVGTMLGVCGYVEPLLGLCWAMLAHVGAMLGLCWAHVGPMLGLWSAGRRGHSGISRHRALCMWLC